MTHIHLSIEGLRQHWKQSQRDLLEVHCASDSQLTAQSVQAGVSAKRFCRDGDLATFHGRCQLYGVLWMFRPRHVWCSHRCEPWSSWNRLNRQKSIALADKITHDRISEKVHLLLCDATFRLQNWRVMTFIFSWNNHKGLNLCSSVRWKT